MRIVRHDGVVELKSTGKVGGPGAKGDLHFGTSYLYARLDGGPWRKVLDRGWATVAIRTAEIPTAAGAFAAITEPDE